MHPQSSFFARVLSAFTGALMLCATLLLTFFSQKLMGTTMVSVNPQTGSTEVDPNTAVIFTFSAPMKNQQAVLWISDTGLLDTNRIAYTWSSDKLTLSASMTGGWPNNKKIQWVLLPSVEGVLPFFPGIEGFQDLDGNDLEGDTEGAFSTKAGGVAGPVTITTTNSCGQITTTTLKTAFTVTMVASQTQTGQDSLIPTPPSGGRWPYEFLATATLQGNAVATTGTVVTAAGESLPLEAYPVTRTLLVYQTNSTFTAFSARYPSGNYQFQFPGASNIPELVDVPLVTGNIPNIKVSNYTPAQSINASQDFILQWNPLGAPTKDPIRIEVFDASDRLILASPDVGCPGSLNGSSTSFKIPAKTLQSGFKYRVIIALSSQLSAVEINETSRSFGIYITTTELSLMTTGGITPPPRRLNIISQPNSIKVKQGQRASMTVSTDGTLPLQFKWSKDGRVIVGQTNATLDIPIATYRDAGIYRVIVSDTSGMRISAPALLEIDSESSIVAWGSNGDGQTNVPPNASTGIVAISAATSGNWTLGLKTNGSLVAWGIDQTSQIALAPKELGFTDIAAGTRHGLALRLDGRVAAWGLLEQTSLPTVIIPDKLTNIVSIAAGAIHSLALKDDGTVVAWGNAADGAGMSTALLDVPHGLNQVIAISASESHNVALKANGTVVVWGSEAIMGSGLQTPDDLRGVIAVAAGYRYSMALKEDGTVTAWGGPNSLTPPPDLRNVVTIAAGYHTAMAVKSNGVVVAWGENNHGQTSVPAGLSNVSAVSAGLFHNLALSWTNQASEEPPRIRLSLPAGGGNILLEVYASTGARLSIETSTDLINWSSENTLVGQGADNPSRININPIENGVQRFWKVRLQ